MFLFFILVTELHTTCTQIFLGMRTSFIYDSAMRKKEISAYFSKLGKKGGSRRMVTMTAGERSASASKAAKARWIKGENAK